MPALLSGFLQNRRLAVVRPFIMGDVLDVGCGNACLADQLLPNQIYVGIDGNPTLIRRLRERRARHSFYQRNLDTMDLDLPQTFDTIVILAVVEHLSQPERLFRQLPLYLKAGGRVLITTPSPLGHRIHTLGARVGLFSQEAAEDHKTIFTLATLCTSLNLSGLAVLHQRLFLLGGNQLCVSAAQKAQL
jgi:2-polyprenyl-3-methyl-5-hydroxy-6-metoxy-1,4-benzoquinol methylase